jgi:predicted metalloprotease
MDWEGRQESQNVDDRRGISPGAIAAGGGGIILVILGLIFGIDPRRLSDMFGGGQAPPAAQKDAPPRKKDPKEERLASFTKVVLRDTEIVWEDLFRKMGRKYRYPTLVLFSGRVDSACGMADSAVGPFYCPADSKVYIDLAFYRDMEIKLKAPGEFARAYVIAHEVGHHVQKLLGYSDRMRRAQSKLRETDPEYNRLSVRLELQADFLAGVWAHHGQKRFKFLHKGDIKDALKAAFEIGDDRLQRRGKGYVVPDSFTHGTSDQRMRWFKDGFDTGDVSRAELLFKTRYEDL